jgi:uncharacterized protein YceK
LRKLLLGLITVTVLSGCNSIESNSEDSGLPEGFKVVTDSTSYGTHIYGLRNVQTGCHFAYVSGIALTQIFTEKNGRSVPYCTDERGKQK